MIILIGGEKGGTGKTTIATNIAVMMMQVGKDVLLIDTDKQGSASFWCAIRDENNDVVRIPCIQKFGKEIGKEITELSKRFDNLIIDAGGQNSFELRTAMTVADKMIIPFQASQFDIWTISAMDLQVGSAKLCNPKLSAYTVINRASTNPYVSEAKDVMGFFEEIEHVQMIGQPLRDRIAYRKAAMKGLSISELENPDSKAMNEMIYIYDEVIKDEEE